MTPEDLAKEYLRLRKMEKPMSTLWALVMLSLIGVIIIMVWFSLDQLIMTLAIAGGIICAAAYIVARSQRNRSIAWQRINVLNMFANNEYSLVTLLCTWIYQNDLNLVEVLHFYMQAPEINMAAKDIFMDYMSSWNHIHDRAVKDAVAAYSASRRVASI
jgi:hypothetical protein